MNDPARVEPSATIPPAPAPTSTQTRPAGPLPPKKAVRRKRVLHRDEPIPPRPDPIDPDVVIRIRGLTKRYGTRTAVDSLNLDVRRGEIFGLLGPNGAGKTTTVLMLLGLTEPSAGDVTVAGFDPRRESLQVKRRVGYLPDSVGFYGGLTGRENLRYTARLNGIPKKEAEERISDVLRQVGLADRADDRADTYSRGMRQRLGIADALVKDPEVLILDEPTTAIDPMGVVEMLALIRGLARDRGIAILLASHLLDQVQSVCQRVGIFDRGRIIGLGSVEELATTFGEPPDRLDVVLEADSAPDSDAAAERLAAVPGVLGLSSLDEGVGRTGWRLTIEPGRSETEVVRAVVDAVLAEGWRIERLGHARPSLEQIYRRAVERAEAAA
jgi:ABC-2 type transport system ATP-binding protein